MRDGCAVRCGTAVRCAKRRRQLEEGEEETKKLSEDQSQVSHIHCANCRTTLMYPFGAPSVKCAICHFITNTTNERLPIPARRPNETTTSETVSSSTSARPHFESQTVVVENPMSIDSSGKLVSNVVVGVTTDKK